jgi:hypothetical protein
LPRLRGTRSIELAYEKIVQFAVEGTKGGYSDGDDRGVQDAESRELLVRRLQASVNRMIAGAEELGILAAVADEDYQLQAHHPVRDPQTKRMLVVTSGVPNLEQAFIASLRAFTENNLELFGFCANRKCGRLFVRPHATSECCNHRRCHWAYRYQRDPAGEAIRKRKYHHRKTNVDSKRGRPHKYPEASAPHEPSPGNKEV